MNSRLIHYFLAAIFFLFGIVQFNDPDFWLWGPVYFVVALIPIFFVKKRLNSTILAIIIFAYSIFLISYIPDFIDWINGGMENIAGSMKAEEPHIELTREFFGIVICLITMSWYYLKLRKITKTNHLKTFENENP